MPTTGMGLDYNIEAGGEPLPMLPMATMAGTPLENYWQASLMRRALQGKWTNTLGGSAFRQWMQANHPEVLKQVVNSKPNLRSFFPKIFGGTGKFLGGHKTNAIANLENAHFQPWLKSLRRSGRGFQAFRKTLPYSSIQMASQAVALPIIRGVQHNLRTNRVMPAAAQYGYNASMRSPTLQVKNALKEVSMKKNAVNSAGMIGIGLGTAIGGEVLGKLFFEHMNDKKREASAGQNWDRLVNRYPEFRGADASQREQIMDLFEGLNAVAPEIAKVPVLAAPMLRNALEYGIQGFSPADLKTMADIQGKMDPYMPGLGAKAMPSAGNLPSLFAMGNAGTQS